MPRGSCTLGMHSHFDGSPHAPRVVYPRNARSVWGYPTCPQGRVPSECIFSLRPPCKLRGSHTLGMRPHFEGIPHDPSVVYARNACPGWKYPARFEGRVPSECALTLRLSRMLRGSRTLEMRVRSEAIPHAPGVVYLRNARLV